MKIPRLLLTGFTALAIGAGGMFATQEAEASSVNSLLNFDGETVNFVDDDNYEYLVDAEATGGLLEVGSVLRGVANFTTINGQGVAANEGIEFTTAFSLRVRDIINPNEPGTAADYLIFEPDPDFGVWLTSIGAGGPALPAVNDQVFARFFENPFPPPANPTDGATPDSAAETFVQGNFYWDLGFADPASASHEDGGAVVSNNGEGWVAGTGNQDAGLAFTAAAGLDPNETIGTGHFVLSRINAASHAEFPIIEQRIGDYLSPGIIAQLGADPDDMMEFWGESSVRGAAGDFADQGWHATSESSLSFVAIPTPAALGPGLVMLGLLGLGRGRRERAAA